MYIPPAFLEANPDVLFDFIQGHSFGILVTTNEGEPFATHLPFLVERSGGTTDCLLGHLARSNPHWEQAEGKTALAIFAGPHSYISPSWYQADNVVPTWNYVTVHAYGTFEAIHDPEGIMRIVQRTVDRYEGSMDQPWKLDTTTKFNQTLINQIVGFRIPISSLEGKWKLSQNQPTERQVKVEQALSQSVNRDSIDVAMMMSARRQANRE